MSHIGLNHLRGKHTGTPAVIVGSGPSTRHIAGREFKNRVVFTVNSSAMLFPNADYFLTSDGGSPRTEHWQHMIKGTSHIILAQSMEKIQDKFGKDRITIFAKSPGVWELNPNANSLIFGIGSAHCAAHMAVVMGCSPIYLIGCECKFENKFRRWWQFPGFPKDDVHIFDHLSEEHQRKTMPSPEGGEYPGNNGVTDNYLCATYQGWVKIRKSSPLVKMYDASAGMLTSVVFPPINLDTLTGTKE